MPCEYKDRDRGDASTNQVTPKVADNAQELGEMHGPEPLLAPSGEPILLTLSS